MLIRVIYKLLRAGPYISANSVYARIGCSRGVREIDTIRLANTLRCRSRVRPNFVSELANQIEHDPFLPSMALITGS